MNPVIVISERDNVATALQALEPGLLVQVESHSVRVIDPIPPGHKVALLRIGRGEPVIKYGSPIGTASTDIEPGSHVHTHNVASARGRGDLEVPATTAQPRLAEPPDDPASRNGSTTLKPRT